MAVDLNKIESILSTLSKSEKDEVLSILEEFTSSGELNKFRELVDKDFEEVPVDIETFITDPQYLGNSFVDANTSKCVIYPFWIETLKKLFTDGSVRFTECVLTGAIGLGKAQPLSSKLVTRDGYKCMRDIKVNDEVFGEDGKLYSVKGIYPQGKKKVYRITFSDNSSAECCEEHLWNIADRTSSKPYEYKTIALKDILNKPLYKVHKALNCKVWSYYIPMTKPVMYSKKKLNIDPYLLGCLIGDGSLSSSSFGITIADSELFNRIDTKFRENGYYLQRYNEASYDYSINMLNHKKGDFKDFNKYKRFIKEYKLDCTAEHKYIPSDYLHSSVDDRIALLQGLMDTAGCVEKVSYQYYATCSPILADNFKELVYSLGGTAKITKTTNNTYKYKYKGTEEVHTCKDSYIIGFKLPKNIQICTSSRKANRLMPNRKEPFRNIRSIEYIGEESCQCIMTSNPSGLYLTDNYVVTHNTSIAVIGSLYILYKLMCLRNPNQYYEQKADAKIYIGFFNITLDLAAGVAYSDFQEALLKSPWFKSRGTVSGRTHLVYNPPKNIEFLIGSKPEHALGKNVFCLTGDTEIRLTDSTYKRLRNIDDKVAVYDVVNNYVKESDAVSKAEHTVRASNFYCITLADGTVINCTGEHQFMLSNGEYKFAKDIVPGDDFKEIEKSTN